VTDKFEFIDVEYAIYLESDEQYVPSIVKMCRWMEVSRSGFYEWRNASESATAKRRGILALYVRRRSSPNSSSAARPDDPPQAMAKRSHGRPDRGSDLWYV